MPVGEQTDEILDLVYRVSRETFKISSRNHRNLLESCEKHKIPCPGEFWAQYFPCYSAADYDILSERLNSEKGFYFYRYISVIAVIDYTSNRDVRSIQESCKKVFKQSYPTGYFIYRATDEIANLFDENTCISLDTYSRSNVINHVKQFSYGFVIKSILQNSVFTSNIHYDKVTDLSLFPKKVSLVCVAVDVNDIYEHFKHVPLPSLDNVPQLPHAAAFFELCAVLERIFTGFMKKIRLKGSFNMLKAPWADSSLEYNNGKTNRLADSFQALSISGCLYYRARYIDKCADCALRSIACGMTQLINNVSSFLRENAHFPMMKHRAYEFIALCTKFHLPRKAALFQFTYADALTDDEKILFYHNCLKLIKDGSEKETNNANSLNGIQYEIALPMIDYLRENDGHFCMEIIADILQKYRYKLPFHAQSLLFQNLSTLSKSEMKISCKNILKFRSIKIEQPKCFIRKIESKETDSIFIYRNMRGNSNKYIYGINQPIHFLVEIENKFQISFPITVSFLESEMFSHEDKVQTLYPFSPTKIAIDIVPYKAGVINFSSIKCTLYNIYEIINFPNPINITVVDQASLFEATTNLHNQYYLGERVNFSIFVCNQGNHPIQSIEAQFGKLGFNIDTSYEKNEIPLNSMETIQVSCKFTVQKKFDNLVFDVICSTNSKNETEGDLYQSVVHIDQPVNIIEGIVPVSIYPVLNYHCVPDFKRDLMLLIGLEIENFSDETFLYKSSFNASESLKKLNINYNERALDENSILLNSNIYQGAISRKRKVIHIFPILIADFINLDIKPNDPRVVRGAKYAELKYNQSQSIEERQKVLDLVKLQAFIESNINFNWQSTDNHEGTLSINNILPDISFINEIKTIYPHISIRFMYENEECNEIYSNKIIDIVIDFNGFMINKCSIDIQNYLNCEYGILWDGKLSQSNQEGSSLFTFSICFTKAGKYSIPFNYHQNDGIDGTDEITMNVLE